MVGAVPGAVRRDLMSPMSTISGMSGMAAKMDTMSETASLDEAFRLVDGLAGREVPAALLAITRQGGPVPLHVAGPRAGAVNAAIGALCRP